jgi:hypothetical protein
MTLHFKELVLILLQISFYLVCLQTCFFNVGARRAMEVKSSPAKKIEQLSVNHQSPLKRESKLRSSFGKGFRKFKRTRSVSEPNLCK